MESSLSYAMVKTANEAREAEEQREELLRKSILILIQAHLQNEGYLKSSDQLQSECGMALDKWEPCDNIDLVGCIREFQSYYKIKFNRPPKLTRKRRGDDGPAHSNSSPRSRRKLSSTTKPLPGIPSSPLTGRGSFDGGTGRGSISEPASPKGSGSKKKSSRTPKPPASKQYSDEPEKQDTGPNFDISGSAVAGAPTSNKRRNIPQIVDYRKELQTAIHGTPDQPYNYHEDKIPKPLTGFTNHYSGDMATLAQNISNDILVKNLDVSWDDLIGLEKAKKVMQEAVVYPIRYPDLFRGILSPWKGLLLFGPPGTGKTMLAKAAATECETTFFNISASSIVSKYRGDSEKLVRVLFELARYHAPSTIFLDEIDSIMSTRGSGGGGSGDHEGSRRMKTELLVQMDGLNKSEDLVFVLAASNLPWELDPAMLRRLEKRILIDLPTEEARGKMFESHLPPDVLEGPVHLKSDLRYDDLAKATDGYSGSDIRLVCKEAAMRPLRKVFALLEENKSSQRSPDLMKRIRLDPVSTADVMEAVSCTKPSAHAFQEKYRAWQLEFESV